MSFEDNTVWRTHLDLYNAPAEALPIIKTTIKNVWTEEWSGEMLHHDGTVEKIGKRKRIALDWNELTCFGSSFVFVAASPIHYKIQTNAWQPQRILTNQNETSTVGEDGAGHFRRH